MGEGKSVRPSKAEKRLDRKVAKELRRKLPGMSDAKLVAQTGEPDTAKVPVSAEPPDPLNARMSWSKVRHDSEGQWSWGVARACKEQVWTDSVESKLTEWAKKTWREIRSEATNNRPKHHEYEVAIICQEAFDRLAVLKLDDQDNIFRFRLDGRKRLYGFIFDAVFNTVWYDPTHQIYPVEPGGKKTRQKKRDRQAVENRRAVQAARKTARQAANAAAKNGTTKA